MYGSAREGPKGNAPAFMRREKVGTGKGPKVARAKITSIDLEESCRTEKPLDLDLLKLASVLAN